MWTSACGHIALLLLTRANYTRSEENCLEFPVTFCVVPAPPPAISSFFWDIYSLWKMTSVLFGTFLRYFHSSQMHSAYLRHTLRCDRSILSPNHVTSEPGQF